MEMSQLDYIKAAKEEGSSRESMVETCLYKNIPSNKNDMNKLVERSAVCCSIGSFLIALVVIIVGVLESQSFYLNIMKVVGVIAISFWIILVTTTLLRLLRLLTPKQGEYEETDISDSKRITEEKYRGDAMIVGAAKIHEKLEEYLNRNYKDIEYWEIASSVLETKITGNDNGASDYYKVTVDYKRTGDTSSRTALVKAEPNTGEIIGFKEGLNKARFLDAFKKKVEEDKQSQV